MMRFLAISSFTLLATLGVMACGNQAGTPSTQSGTVSSSTAAGGKTGTSTHASGGNSSSSSKTSKSSNAQGGTDGSSESSGGTSSEDAEGGSTATSTSGGSSNKGSSASSAGGSSAKSSASAATTGGTSAKGGTSGVGPAAGNGGRAGGPGLPVAAGNVAKGGSSAMGPVGGGVARGGGATIGAGGAASGGTSSAAGGTKSSGVTVTPVTNGKTGFTTRYWDCCMPSCSWKNNAGGKNPVKVCNKDGTSTTTEQSRNACDGGGGFMCYWGAPWQVGDKVSYGYAAYNGVPCGTCFQLDFTGKGHYGANPGAQALAGKSMIVQVINIGGIASDQFDLLIPGGGVGAMNACTANGNQWAGIDIGAQSGGILTACNNDKTCAANKCKTAFAGKPDLLAGCEWFTTWFEAADNPEITFKQLSSCPSELTQKSGMN